ncbi:Anaphase-promoting complex subunit 1 [Cynara cardunculus var. scolymus]|uniref:Anaphase-promoting complex subunit 1 n=1 Tax=Cynara cardunculus var. scolymus TaxID=59895 RepID=A0A118JWY0_CYNCS|nr:Anaphase-promoting complex subunit 1 [Cynara cardunculus var. scolymus]
MHLLLPPDLRSYSDVGKMQGEIGRRSGGDNVLEREGYAGFSLGLVAFGRGLDAIGFMDTLLERLFQYAGGKEIHNLTAV